MATLAERIVGCRRCPRLRAHCEEVARAKRRAYRDQDYWGLPVPGFGAAGRGAADPRLWVVGLAPGAHGANRTGRVFTGDPSGDWLFRALFETGFANQPDSLSRDDGLELVDAAIACVVRCAPPQNRPRPAELTNCRTFLVEEIRAFRRLRVIVALGRIATDSLRRAWCEAGRRPFPRARFGHGVEVIEPEHGVVLVTGYHPSQQNTRTGRLTRDAFHRCFRRAREIADD